MSRRSAVPKVPTLPEGVEIASFGTYIEAQRAVDHLSERDFPLTHVTIVGTDLRMVERITGKLSVPRVALGGALTGAWFGIFVGLIFGLMSEANVFAVLVPSIMFGAGFGLVFGLVSYAFSRGNRDFTSASQVVASRYALLCDVSHAYDARQIVRQGRTGVPSPMPPQAAGNAPVAPPTFGASSVTPTSGAAPETPSAPAGSDHESQPERSSFRPLLDSQGRPRYGQMRTDTEQSSPASGADAGDETEATR